MTEAQIAYFNKVRFAEMPEEVKARAVQGLKDHLPEGIKLSLKRMILAYGVKWWTIGGWHFYGGMTVRNLLRSEIGLLDNCLPSGNWDDYYIPCVEAALEDIEIQGSLPQEPYDGD